LAFIIIIHPVVARSKAWARGHSLSGIAGSNPGADVDVCLLWLWCVVRWKSLQRADPSTRAVLPIAVCLSMIEERHTGSLGPLGALSHKKKVVTWLIAGWSKDWWVRSKHNCGRSVQFSTQESITNILQTTSLLTDWLTYLLTGVLISP